VASHINKRHVRRQIGIGQRPRLRDVSALQILETRAHSMPNQQVHNGLRSMIAGPLANIE
jgi:hypothetical protein